MSTLSSFRDVRLLHGLADRLRAHAPDRPMTLMEVCGSHTMAIHRSGIRSLLPATIRLLSGPGCPVCVTPRTYLDTVLTITREHGVTPVTFGDMMRVPGATGNLIDIRMSGAKVEVVYSPLGILELATADPDTQFMFISVGFETTTPTIAATIKEAAERKLSNVSFAVANKILPPALTALVSAPELHIDGFLLPGHVSLILGSEPYQFLAQEHRRCGAIAGFEPADILQAILILVDQFKERKPAIANPYNRTVRAEGNVKARKLIDELFTVCDTEWRGFGIIPASGLTLREEYHHFDAIRRFPVKVDPVPDPSGCRCGDVLRGSIDPPDCPLFARSCTPQKPVGACMVSSEGSCAAYYKYSRD
jgi:hydrogenase expression/formation protein HypD